MPAWHSGACRSSSRQVRPPRMSRAARPRRDTAHPASFVPMDPTLDNGAGTDYRKRTLESGLSARVIDVRRQSAAMRGTALVLLASGPLVGSGAARAQTDEIQVYDAGIAAPGQLNLTWHNYFT